MNKTFIFSLFFSFLFTLNVLAQDVVGFWKTIDDKTGKPQSIVAIYEYQGKYFGRIIATYNDQGKFKDTIYLAKERAPGVEGNPHYAGMDIIWDLEKDKNGSKYKSGSILDPLHGRIYDAEIWVENGKLVVRGKILFLGRNQTWPPVNLSEFPQGFKIPELHTLIPAIPTVID